MAFKKRPILITPTGVAVFPHLHSPDTKFKAEGKYTTKLRFASEEEAQPVLDALNEALEEAKALSAEKVAEAKKAKKPQSTIAKLQKELDLPVSVDDETGEVTINFSMTASGISKKDQKPWTRSPAIVDANKKPVKNLKIGGGSRLKVAFTTNPFCTALGYGVSLRLEAVQVIELQTWGSAAASAFDTEDGFDASEADEDAFVTATAREAAEDLAGDGETADAGNEDF